MNAQNPTATRQLRHLHPVPSISFDWERLINDWLATKRSQHTRRVYQADIENFLSYHEGLTWGKFLTGALPTAYELVSRYRGKLIQAGLTAATINRRLAALKSLVSYAHACGHCEWKLETVKGEKLKAYRDTSGIEAESFRGMLATCDLDTLKGVRDYALLLLLWGNALRRSEVSKAAVKDFDPQSGTLQIYGKGRGTELEKVTLGKAATAALSNWLEARGATEPEAALFCSVNPAYAQGRLTGQAIYDVVKARAAAAGIPKLMSPHRIRHSSITAALDATGGDVRKVQKLSRHANLNTLMIYDDNRVDHQGEVTAILEKLI